MPRIDREWVANQLKDAKVSKTVGNIVMELLEHWNNLKVEDIKNQKQIAEIFSKLAVGIPIHVPVEKEEVWVQAMAGRIKVGDEVMVKEDAFEGELATIHNGRRGRVVAVRYGDIIVNSTDDKEPKLVGTHYNPMALLKLVEK